MRLGLGFDTGLLALSQILWGIGSGLYFYVWPIYVSSLGAGPYEVGLLLALAGVSSIAGFALGGVVEARFDWRAVMLVGWVTGGLAVLVYAVAQIWWALAPGVFLLSFSGFCDPSLSSYIAAASRRDQLGRTFTTVFSGFSLGMAISPAIGGLLSAKFGMHAVFYLALGMYVLSTISIIPIRSRRRDPDSGPGPVLDGRGTRYLAPLAEVDFRRLIALLFALFTTGYLGISLVPLFLNAQAGLSTEVVGGLGTIASLGGVTASLWLARTSDRMGIHRALGLTHILLVLSFVLVIATPLVGPLGPIAVYVVAGSSYLLRGSQSAQFSLGRASVLHVLPRSVAGRGFAIALITLGAGQTIGPYAAGLLYTWDPRAPLVISAGVGLVFAVLIASRPLVRHATSEPTAADRVVVDQIV